MALPFVEAVLPSDGLNRVSYRVYKSVSRVVSLFFPFLSSFFGFFFFIRVPAVDRSIDPRLIALRESTAEMQGRV